MNNEPVTDRPPMIHSGESVLLHRPARNRGLFTRRSVGEFADLAGLDVDAFVRRFPNPVLLVHPPDPQVADEAPTTRCDRLEDARHAPLHHAGRLPSDLSPVRVLTVRKKASGEGETIWLGRSRRCDLLIVDRTISKMHALITYDHEGRLVLGDGASTNGTFLDEQRLTPGRMVPLHDGAVLRFGALHATWMLPSSLFGLVRQLA